MASPANNAFGLPPTPVDDAQVTFDVGTYAAVTDEPIAARPILYSSAYLALFQAAQFGWSLSQLNLSTFHTTDDCAARPVVDGTCLMFPGHSSTQWTWIVNAWVIGGMVGSLGCGRVSDRFGRKNTFLANCVIMALGAIVQASASSVAVFAIGRAIAGLSSGAATAMPNGYISEIAPPHLRNKLGVGYQVAIALGLLLVSVTFFFADTPTGWRYIAAVPAGMAAFFVAAAPRYMVESPAWLLTKGRQADAETEIAKLFGEHNVSRALAWMQPPSPPASPSSQTSSATSPTDTSVPLQPATINKTLATNGDLEAADTQSTNPWKAMFTPTYRQQTILAVAMALALQFSGINAVFLYSSSMFTDAGVADGRIGSVIVNVVNLLPSFAAGKLATRFGNRGMILFGQVFMLACAVCLTVSLLIDVEVLSIVFTAAYVAGFSVSLGPLAFVVATEVFPDELRASGGSLTLFANWSGTLLIGVGYPYVADALGDLGFLPFIVTLVLFTVFLLKYLPETSGKTGDEIQEIYRRKLRAKTNDMATPTVPTA